MDYATFLNGPWVDQARYLLKQSKLKEPLRKILLPVMGEECSNKILNLDFEDLECYKLLISRGLSTVVFTGASLIKIPQIVKIIHNKSAEGLSWLSYVMEIILLCLYSAYYYRNGSSFLMYGESLLILFQNAIILWLIAKDYKYGRALKLLLIVMFSILISLFNPGLVSFEVISRLQILTLFCAIFAKLPQVLKNYGTKNVGQLSFTTVFLQATGAIARIITNYIESTNMSLILCSISNFILSAVTLYQFMIYDNTNSNSKKYQKLSRKPPLHKKNAHNTSKSNYTTSRRKDI